MIIIKQKQKEILKLEEEFKDKIQIDLEKEQKEDKRVTITNIKLAGKASWQDKINGKLISENVFIVEIEISETEEDGHKRKTKQEKIYLGEEHIAGRIVGYNKEIIFNPNFEKIEIDKFMAVNNLLNKVSEKAIEENSLNTLKRKEISEVLSAYYGRQVSEDEVEKMIKEKQNSKTRKKDLDKKGEQKENEKDNLSEKATKNVNDINPQTKRNNTTYSLVGMKKDVEAKVLNDEFEMDKSAGSSASKNSTKIRANNTATRDNKDLSVYTRKSNGASIGCENNQGNIDIFFYQRTLKDNEKVGIQVETSQTKAIPLETRELLSENKGISRKDKVKDETEKHTKKGCNPSDIRDFDGKEDTSSHKHIDNNIDYKDVDERDYIPNTDMTCIEFANRCGYRGEGWLKVAVEAVNKLTEINQENLNKFIDDIEDDYGENGKINR